METAKKTKHWREFFPSDNLAASDLQERGVKHLALTISHAAPGEVHDTTTSKKKKLPILHFVEKGIKPMALNVTNCQTIESITGTPDYTTWRNVAIVVYLDKAKYAGKLKDCLRIKPSTACKKPPEETIPIPPCQNCNKPIIDSDGFTAAQIAVTTLKRHGASLCFACHIEMKDSPAEESPDTP